MKQLRSYINIHKSSSIIHATDDNIQQIVKDELDRFGHNANLNHIDVSEVTNMYRLFSCHTAGIFDESYKDLNPDISQWDVSNVKNISYMFFKCHKFNCDISSWDVSKVDDMKGMFYACKKFNQPLDKWDVKNVTSMSLMFARCDNFNQSIGNWDVSNVKDMLCMFKQCKKFNQDISGWDVSNVENMNYMFDSCPIKEEFKPKFKK